MCAQLCLTLATPWTVACQAPVSIAFLRQEYWSGVPFPPPGDLPIPGTEPASPASPALQADSLPIELPGKPFSWSSRVHCMDRHNLLICYLSQNSVGLLQIMTL